MGKHTKAVDALAKIRSGHRVFVHGASATPERLIEGLVERAGDLRDVELLHLHTVGRAAYAKHEYKDSFKVTNLFVGGNMRGYLDYDRVDYLPCFLSEIPELFRARKRPVDVALIHVSPPDSHGFCTLGTSVDAAKAAVDSAEIIIAQINRRMPQIHGDGFIHVSAIDDFIEIDEPLPSVEAEPPNEIETAIGRQVASLVEDGATLQAGIGAVPDAALAALTNHKNLGLHTEMWSNGALPLIEKGVINNSRKGVHPGKSVSAFIVGNQAVYDFIHDNPSVVQFESGYVNNVSVIARNPKVMAINSAIEVDLTGQVCADSVGSRIISGVGGQMDFIRGATLSSGGKAVIALTSRSKNGSPRLVSQLRPGAGVVTTRAHVHFVVTEYGIADLYGKTLGERARSLIGIAHPDDRERLEREWCELIKTCSKR